MSDVEMADASSEIPAEAQLEAANLDNIRLDEKSSNEKMPACNDKEFNEKMSNLAHKDSKSSPLKMIGSPTKTGTNVRMSPKKTCSSTSPIKTTGSTKSPMKGEVPIMEEQVCRYCFEGYDEQPEEELISPCKCAGGQEFVHLKCLRRWQRMVLVTQPTHPAFYDRDKRHHICNVCNSEFTCPPPTRCELMTSFTGPEIAALIEKNSVIATHETFNSEIEASFRTMSRMMREMSGYDHWYKAVMLITDVEEDEAEMDLPVSHDAMLIGLRRHLVPEKDEKKILDKNDKKDQPLVAGSPSPGFATVAASSAGAASSTTSSTTSTGSVETKKVEVKDGYNSTVESSSSPPKKAKTSSDDESKYNDTKKEDEKKIDDKIDEAKDKRTLSEDKDEEEIDDEDMDKDVPLYANLQGTEFQFMPEESLAGVKNVRAAFMKLKAPCKLKLRKTRAPTIGDDHVRAVNLTRELAKPPDPGYVSRALKRVKWKGAGDKVRIKHFIGGPCDEEEVQCCLVLGGSGSGWTVVKDLTVAVELAYTRGVTRDPAEGNVHGGQIVRLHSLKACPDLNDEIGLALRFNPSSGRWFVRLCNGDGKALKPANLEAIVDTDEPSDKDTSGEKSDRAKSTSGDKGDKPKPVSTILCIWGDARWSRAQLLGEIAKHSWGLCRGNVGDFAKGPKERWANMEGRLVFAPKTEMSENYAAEAEREMRHARMQLMMHHQAEEEDEDL